MWNPFLIPRYTRGVLEPSLTYKIAFFAKDKAFKINS